MLRNLNVKDATRTTMTWRGSKLAVPSSHLTGSFEIRAISKLPLSAISPALFTDNASIAAFQGRAREKDGKRTTNELVPGGYPATRQNSKFGVISGYANPDTCLRNPQ